MASHTTCDAGAVFPAEIMDLVLDQLCSDLKMLGVCGMVCSEWLTRSRYHIFSTVNLWPWRARRFFELSSAQVCTFTKHVNCIEVDDARVHNSQQTDCEDLPFHKIISLPAFSRFSHIKALRIRNADWTLMPLSAQYHLRNHLSRFTELKSLELDDVMFHDLRELAHIAALFPSLSHLVTNVQFSKYMEHAISSATVLTLPKTLQALHLGTDDAIPVLLSTSLSDLNLSSLSLEGVKFWHLQYIGGALRKLGGQLRHLAINFSRSDGQWINSSDLAHLDLNHQTRLQYLDISGVFLSEDILPHALSLSVPSLVADLPTPSHLERLAICTIPESEPALRYFDWAALGRSLGHHPQCFLNLDVMVPFPLAEREVEEYIRAELKTLEASGRLNVRS